MGFYLFTARHYSYAYVPGADGPSLPRVEAELRSMWAEYVAAVKAGDAVRVAALYADSIYFMETGAPTRRSREALAAFAAEALGSVRIVDEDSP